MDSLNILLVGNNGSGKTSFYTQLLENIIMKDIPTNNVLLINNLKEQGIHITEVKLKHFVKLHPLFPQKKIYYT